MSSSACYEEGPSVNKISKKDIFSEPVRRSSLRLILIGRCFKRRRRASLQGCNFKPGTHQIYTYIPTHLHSLKGYFSRAVECFHLTA